MKRYCFIFILALVGGGVLLSSPAQATTIISPVLELTADPGTKQPGVVKVYNETAEPMYLVASVEAFTAGANEDGQPQYLTADQQQEFLTWFKLSEDTILLPPRQAAIVPFTVDIPAEATPGGYYATIFWQNIPPQRPGDANAKVAVLSKVGTLVFLRVNGEVIEAGEVIEFGIREGAGVHYRLPLTFFARVANTGTVHLQPQATVILRSAWGSRQVLPLGDGKGNVLPGSTRQFEAVLGQTSFSDNFLAAIWQEVISELQNFSIGPYTATLELSYGLDNQYQATQEINFWIIPVHLISAAFGLIILLILWRRSIYRMKKIKNKPS